MSDEPNLVAMTIEVVANYVAHNTIAPDDVPGFIAKTHAAITGLTATAGPAAAAPDEEPPAEHVPAVSVRKSTASRDHILSMIDGRPYKTLKRHLSRHGLTPAQYRERYKLKDDYPMVAPAYSEHRREVAKTLGLGRKPRADAPSTPAEPVPAASAAADARAKPSRSHKPTADAPAAAPARRRRSKAAGAPADNPPEA